MRKINNTFGTSNRKNAFRIRNEMKKKKKILCYAGKKKKERESINKLIFHVKKIKINKRQSNHINSYK